MQRFSFARITNVAERRTAEVSSRIHRRTFQIAMQSIAETGTFSRVLTPPQNLGFMLCFGGMVGLAISSYQMEVPTPLQRLQAALTLRGSLAPQTPLDRLKNSLALRGSLAPPSSAQRIRASFELRSRINLPLFSLQNLFVLE